LNGPYGRWAEKNKFLICLFKNVKKFVQDSAKKTNKQKRRKVARLGHSVCMEMEKFVGLKKVQSLKVFKKICAQFVKTLNLICGCILLHIACEDASC